MDQKVISLPDKVQVVGGDPEESNHLVKELRPTSREAGRSQQSTITCLRVLSSAFSRSAVRLLRIVVDSSYYIRPI
jgi:hypothetical protein